MISCGEGTVWRWRSLGDGVRRKACMPGNCDGFILTNWPMGRFFPGLTGVSPLSFWSMVHVSVVLTEMSSSVMTLNEESL